MSNNNNERRELTAAELDLVSGGNTFQDCMISNYFMAPLGETTSAGTGNNSTPPGAMYDIRQSKAV